LSAVPASHGPLRLLTCALRRISRGRVRLLHYRIVAQPVPAASAPRVTGGRGLAVERVGPEHVLLAQFPHRPDALRRRFAQHAMCYGAHRHGELAGYLWVQEPPFADRDAGCCFVPAPAGRAAWDYDLWIAPAWRMSRAFQRLWDAAHDDLRARGIAWTLSCVQGANRTSLASHQRLGARAVSQAWILRIGERQLAAFTQPPFVDLNLFTGARARLVVRAPQASRSDA
jgi:hypothetical protein